MSSGDSPDRRARPVHVLYTNVRSHLPKGVWDRLRRQVAAQAGCEICGGRGRRWAVECHEVWHYDDAAKVQRRERLVALRPDGMR